MGERKYTIYFIQAGVGGPIKIGYTTGSPFDRMAALQTGNQEKLRLLGTMPGGRHVEQNLHMKFRGERMEGEWFKPSDHLVGFVDGVRSASGHVNDSAAKMTSPRPMPRPTRPPVPESPEEMERARQGAQAVLDALQQSAKPGNEEPLASGGRGKHA